jgi:parallel beta-helix repeat protein
MLLFVSVTIIPSNSTKDVKQSPITFFNDGTLSGYVNDTSMNPLVGALVRVYFHGTYEEDITDSSGYYHVTNIPICNCTKNCTAFKSGFKPEWILIGIFKNTTHDFVLTPGNKLYVGGTVNNYSKIQDAINAAKDGDTIFVYDDSSPYFENLNVNKSIILIGEDIDTTIINGNQKDCVIKLYADGIKISNFTIQNAGFDVDLAGILVKSSMNLISSNNITSNTYYGNAYGILILENSHNNYIINNLIQKNYHAGIETRYSNKNYIAYNYFTDNAHGSILLGWSSNNTINNNKIKDYICLAILGSFNNSISRNHFINHGIALVIVNSSNNIITENNFILQRENIHRIFIRNVFLGSDRNAKNTWNYNYWNRPRLLPKFILGFGKIDNKKIRFVEIDWHPAQEPYDIEV